MKDEEFDRLDTGDVLRNASTGEGWVVQANYRGHGVILARTLLARNASEWKLVSKAHREEPV